MHDSGTHSSNWVTAFANEDIFIPIKQAVRMIFFIFILLILDGISNERRSICQRQAFVGKFSGNKKAPRADAQGALKLRMQDSNLRPMD